MTTTTVSVLPLTTTFTAPESCLSSVYHIGYATNTALFNTVLSTITYLTWSNLGPTSASECFPSGWSPTTYFSPGICPSGYSIANSSLLTIGPSIETRATCCPLNYTILQTTDLGSDYIGSWYSTEPCAMGTLRPISTDSDGVYSDRQYTNAYPVSIRWQAADFKTTAPQTTSTGVKSTNPADSLAPSSGLSTGAKIGIGVGVSLGVILATVLILATFCVRRRRRQNDKPQLAEMPASTNFTTELASDRTTTRAELNGATPPELLGTSRAELDSSTRAELGAEKRAVSD